MSVDLVTAVTASALVLWFLASGNRIAGYVAGVIVIGIVHVGVALRFGTHPQACLWVLSVLASASVAFALLIVRIMLMRSVSLRMLHGLETGVGTSASSTDDIAGRVVDLRHHGLVCNEGGNVRLTGFGRCVSALTRCAYRLTGQPTC